MLSIYRAGRVLVSATLALMLALSGLVLTAPTPARAATTFHVTSLGDPAVTPGTCPHTTNCTLRAALTAAAATGYTIVFDVTGTISLSSPFNLTKSVTIQGPGSASLALDGGGSRQIFNIGFGLTIGISGMTLQNA